MIPSLMPDFVNPGDGSEPLTSRGDLVPADRGNSWYARILNRVPRLRDWWK